MIIGKMKKHDKVIIWGFAPPSQHTHSYIHKGYYDGFKYLGIPTYWIDQQHLGAADIKEAFTNALVVTEAFATPGMPLDKSSTYVVHYLGNKGPMETNPGPNHFLGNVGRLIDLRYNADNWHDKNYDYELDRSKCQAIGSGSFFEKGKDYDNLYSLFATDLLPEQIKLEDRFIERDPDKYAFFAGTIRPDNENKVTPFLKACEENNVRFIHNNSWVAPLSTQQIREKISKAYMAPDFRGDTTHLAWGYVPCRLFKNISYGHLGVTNSKAVYEFFDGNVGYNNDPYLMFYSAVKNLYNYDMIRNTMSFVKDHHTYVNRAEEIIKVVDEY
jgi:hypothetical protein